MGLLESVKGLINENPLIAIGGATAAGIGIGLGASAIAKSIGNNGTKGTSRKTRRRIKHTKRGWKQDRKRRSKQKWEVAYQKRKRRLHRRHLKSRSRKGIHYTKKGQPYKILSNGKARFIKKKRR